MADTFYGQPIKPMLPILVEATGASKVTMRSDHFADVHYLRFIWPDGFSHEIKIDASEVCLSYDNNVGKRHLYKLAGDAAREYSKHVGNTNFDAPDSVVFEHQNQAREAGRALDRLADLATDPSQPKIEIEVARSECNVGTNQPSREIRASCAGAQASGGKIIASGMGSLIVGYATGVDPEQPPPSIYDTGVKPKVSIKIETDKVAKSLEEVTRSIQNQTAAAAELEESTDRLGQVLDENAEPTFAPKSEKRDTLVTERGDDPIVEKKPRSWRRVIMWWVINAVGTMGASGLIALAIDAVRNT